MAQAPAAPRTVRRTRLTATAVGLVLLATTVVVGAAPADAAVPSAPKILGVIGYEKHSRLWFTAPASDGGSPITKYTITRVRNPIIMGEVPTTFVVNNTAMWTDPTSLTGSEYRYTVTATNADGDSPPSNFGTVKLLVGLTDYSRFPTVRTFIKRQYQDILGRQPTDPEVSLTFKQIDNGTLSAPDFFEELLTDASRASRLSVIRLYFAYFKRAPDGGGLGYWTRQLNAGKSLDVVSNAFARSSEFRTTYGSLSNVDFVTLVYQNVLGREPEQSGFEYWTGQLADGLAIRGRVMTEFSESNEYKNTSRGKVEAADLWNTMFRTNISPANLALYSSHLDFGGTQGALATLFVTFPQYLIET